MKRINILSVVTIILLFMIHSNVLADIEWLKLKEGDTLPEIRLPVPKNQAYRNYLGLTGEGSFGIQDINAKVVIIQIYRYGCAQCQAEAPAVNKLYRYLVNNPKTKGKVKLIGIAAGDDIHYVKFFAKEFKVRFPLFPDKDYTTTKKIGAEGHPIFIGVGKRVSGNSKVFYTHIGPIKRAKSVLYDIIEKSGLK